MKRPRDELLAGAALPTDQNGRVARSGTSNQLARLLNPRARTSKPFDRRFSIDLTPKAADLPIDLEVLDASSDRDHQRIGLNGFRNEVVRASLNRTDRFIEITNSSQNDRSEVRVTRG